MRCPTIVGTIPIGDRFSDHPACAPYTLRSPTGFRFTLLDVTRHQDTKQRSGIEQRGVNVRPSAASKLVHNLRGYDECATASTRGLHAHHFSAGNAMLACQNLHTSFLRQVRSYCALVQCCAITRMLQCSGGDLFCDAP